MSAGGVGQLLDYYAGLVEDRSRSMAGSGGRSTTSTPTSQPAGGGAEVATRRLALSGEVTGADLRSLLEGQHPQHGGVLGRRFGRSSARGFDATFSAPKSVSASVGAVPLTRSSGPRCWPLTTLRSMPPSAGSKPAVQ